MAFMTIGRSSRMFCIVVSAAMLWHNKNTMSVQKALRELVCLATPRGFATSKVNAGKNQLRLRQLGLQRRGCGGLRLMSISDQSPASDAAVGLMHASVQVLDDCRSSGSTSVHHLRCRTAVEALHTEGCRPQRKGRRRRAEQRSSYRYLSNLMHVRSTSVHKLGSKYINANLSVLGKQRWPSTQVSAGPMDFVPPTLMEKPLRNVRHEPGELLLHASERYKGARCSFLLHSSLAALWFSC